MNHSQVQDKLFEWHDRELPPGQAEEVRVHVQSCAQCQTFIADWDRTAQALLVPLKITDSPVFVQNVMRQVRLSAPERTQTGSQFFARWALPGFALSFSSFAVAFLYVSQASSSSSDGLFIADSQSTSSEWISNVAKDDQLFGSLVEKP